MEQLSPPFRIALVAVLAVGALWMVVLRPHGSTGTSGAAAAAAPAAPAPKPASSSGPTAPGVNGLSRAVQHARDAAAGKPTGNPVPATATAKPSTPSQPVKSAAAQAAAAKATPARAQATAPTPAAAVKAKPAKPVATAPARSTLLLFAGAGADDAAARSVVRSLRGPRVRTIIAPLSHLDLYKALIGNITIATSPTLLVIGPDMHAQEFVGLLDRVEVQQALAATRH